MAALAYRLLVRCCPSFRNETGRSRIFGEGAELQARHGTSPSDWRIGLAPRPRNPMSEVSVQFAAAAALARARSLQAARIAFISVRSAAIRAATPLYFFVVPVTFRLTAPWLTRP